MFTKDFSGEAVAALVLKSQTITTTTTGSAVNLSGYTGEFVLIAAVTKATAGTLPTCDVTIEDSADGSTDWTLIATVPQVTAAADVFLQDRLDMREVRKYIRAVATVGGTDTPTFALSVCMIGQKQNQ